jgi:ABC-type transport system substrate-binding protein
LVGLALAVLAGACGGSGGDDGGSASGTSGDEALTPVAGGTLRYGLNAETDGWNPTTNRWADSGHVVGLAIFDRLALHDEDGNAVPYLAEAITPNEDFTSWTISLRPNIEFHDTTPLTAEAVKLNLEGHLESGLTAPGFAPLDTITVVDDLTLRLDMKSPWSAFPQILTTQVGTVAAPSMLEDPDGAANPVGTGPFVFVSWTRDNELRVKKNHLYWRDGYPLVDNVIFRVVPDELSRNQGLIGGELHVAMVNTAPQVVELEELAADGDMQVFHGDEGEQAEGFVVLNLDDPALADPRVRRALAHATDRQEIIDTVFAGVYEPATGPFAPDSPWYVETDYPDFDLEAARQLVRQIEEETGEIELTLQGPPSNTNLQLRQLLIDQWSRAGITARATSNESAVNILNVIAGNYQASTWGHFDSPHPDGDYVWWHSSNANPPPQLGLNYVRNRDPEVDAALDAARATDDFEEQKAQYAIVQERFAADVPYLWMYHTDDVVAARPEVHDVVSWTVPDGTRGLPILSMRHPLYQVWLEP